MKYSALKPGDMIELGSYSKSWLRDENGRSIGSISSNRFMVIDIDYNRSLKLLSSDEKVVYFVATRLLDDIKIL